MQFDKQEVDNFLNSDGWVALPTNTKKITQQLNSLKLENDVKNKELLLQFFYALKEKDLFKALEIVNDPTFDVNQTVGSPNNNNKLPVDLDDSLQTPLHIALSFDAEESETKWFQYSLNNIIEALCARGANINAQDSIGYTPLHHAVDGNLPFSVFALLKLNADQDICNAQNHRPIELALDLGLAAIVRILLLAKPSLTITSDIIEYAKDYPDAIYDIATHMQKQLEKKDRLIEAQAKEIAALKQSTKANESDTEEMVCENMSFYNLK